MTEDTDRDFYDHNHELCGGCSLCIFPASGEDPESIIERYGSFITAIELGGFDNIGSGAFRSVWKRKNIVIKIPVVEDGIIDNRVEAAAWRKYKNKPTDLGAYLAPCRLLSNDCLIMMTVDTAIDKCNLPSWASVIDCEQVGLYKKNYVAYDYALDIKERVRWEREWKTKSSFFHEHWLDKRPAWR